MRWEDIPGSIPAQAYARRLIRARNWHLFQAGRARNAAVEQSKEVERHNREADRLETAIKALGFDPQPPMGPRAV